MLACSVWLHLTALPHFSLPPPLLLAFQPIFDNQDPPGYSFTNCSDPRSQYYDREHCTGCHFNQKEAEFSFTLGRFWTQFARSGAPSSKFGEWPAIGTKALEARNIYLRAGEVSVEKDMGRPEACAFWDDVHKQAGGML